MHVVNTFRRDTLSGKSLDPAHHFPVAEFIDRNVPDRVPNVQVENSLISMDGPWGGADEEINMFLHYFRHVGNI
ncbi:hypothetical protein Pure05_40300 [Paenarthrobacter ureafaciens]|nr:hypothetical protein Pure01_40590 [Paenarthrobacter ureafaciens]GLU65820.1 hypothetical protein Pure02_40700 [Paenarthrobacter ureafaciens]GLU70103.1 hypothetical protein Pure03_40790 [Paenarthrobacter ureafaciens]GLU74379.1 hypothetical protein Pure04_40940 [Paenarthrobacter ureafaciens]GLU78590.1 hypothetical protein Pure05_40300 [Paenarthrobacter ureafaciens]